MNLETKRNNLEYSIHKKETEKIQKQQFLEPKNVERRKTNNWEEYLIAHYS